VVVAARQILAYPTGVEIEFEGHARGPYPADAASDPEDFEGPLSHHTLSFRLRLGDGTDVALDDDAGLRTGRGPMLSIGKSERSSGGPDNHESTRVHLWIWPLPPPGPFTVSCSWPRRGLEAVDLVLDGDAIRAAADRAERFWPEDS
jgi:hypothetical protein